MTASLFITSAEGHAGKSMIALGVLTALKDAGKDVGLFRPVSRSRSEPDALLERLLTELDISDTPEQCIGVTYEEVHEAPEVSLSTIIGRYNELASNHDVMVIFGSDYTDVAAPTEFAYNARIAANLGSPILLVIGGRSLDEQTPSNSQFLTGAPRTPVEIRQVVEMSLNELHSEHAELAAVVINRVEEQECGAAIDAVKGIEEVGEVPVWAIPEHPLLVAPSMRDLQENLKGQLVVGTEDQLDNPVLGYIVSGMAMEHVLERLEEGSAIVVPGDRSEVLVAVMMAQASDTFPNLSGIILNGGFQISPVIKRLIDGVDANLPIVSVPSGTFLTVLGITRTRGGLGTAGSPKLAAGQELFARHVDRDELVSLAQTAETSVITPLMFEHRLMVRARANKKHIVLPEGSDDRIIVAAAEILAQGAAELTILGEPEDIRAAATRLDVDISEAHLVSPNDPELIEQFAQEYARVRAHKGMTVERAREIVPDVSYFGTMMIHMGMADGMVSGAAHTTAHTIKPSFEIIKTTPDVSIVSSVFLMALQDRVLVYGDCAVNPNPTAEQLADIAISSAKTARQFNIEPRIAMLSYSTGTSGAGDDVERVRLATDLVRERAPELLVEGPIQYDAAADATVAASKLPDSAVAGQATVFIFPDLNTGNNTYKAVQRSAGAVAIGPVLQGLRRPINDLSRGALVKDIVNTVAITVIQAQGIES